MPGLLTPERRRKARNRSRAGSNKNSLKEKIKKSRPKQSSYQALSVDTAALPSNGSSSGDSYNSGEYTNGSYNSDINSILASTSTHAQTITPTESSSSPRRRVSSTIPHSPSSSTGSPASLSKGNRFQTSPEKKYAIQEDLHYVSDEEMPDDEMMEKRKQLSPKNKNKNRNMHSIPPKQTVANSGRVTPAKEVGNVLGLSNIMAI